MARNVSPSICLLDVRELWYDLTLPRGQCGNLQLEMVGGFLCTRKKKERLALGKAVHVQIVINWGKGIRSFMIFAVGDNYRLLA